MSTSLFEGMTVFLSWWCLAVLDYAWIMFDCSSFNISP